MKITEVELYRVNSGNRGEKGAEFGESQSLAEIGNNGKATVLAPLKAADART
jgi:hypothetical protein